MIPRPPRSTRTDTLFPYTTLFRSIDAAIALARSIDPALYAARLDQDKIFPIAAKALTDDGRAITVPEQLQRLTVLLHREMPETFAEWKKAVGMPYLEPAGIDFFDSGPLLRSEKRRGGKEWVRTVKARGAACPL